MALLAVSAAFFWNTAENVETFSGGKADIYVAPKPHPLTGAERVAVSAVTKLFVETAVARDHPERAYEIVNADMRGGLTRRQWANGDIPVVPYPVARSPLEGRVLQHRRRRPGREGLSDEGRRAQADRVLDEPRADPGRRRQSLAGEQLGAEGRQSVRDRRPAFRGGGASQEDLERISPTASVLWLLVPVVLICLVFVIPVVFLVRERRITRRMRRQLDSRSL